MLRTGIALVVLLSSLLSSPTSSACASHDKWTTKCVSNSGSQVDTSGITSAPGSRPAVPKTGTGDPRRPEPAPEPPCPLNRCDLDYQVVGLPDVTASDLASFRPAPPSLASEPAGLAVVGMPANVVGAASEQRIAGSLLGFDVVVRFVPASFVFDYGDGSTARSATGGSTWERLGQAQFTPTPTSHAYGARGSYRVGVTVHYEASVDFGTGVWRPVTGYVTATTGGYGVRVVDVRTALVDKTCIEAPSGPGC